MVGTCVLDLDHTILEMRKVGDMPANDGFAEDVASFEHAGTTYEVALRVGTTSLVTALKAAKIRVVIATCNLVAHKVMAALAARCDIFSGLECQVFESRDKGAKSLKALGIEPRRVSFPSVASTRHQVVILDDSPSAWTAADQAAIIEARRYDVRVLAQVDDDDDLFDEELGYLMTVKNDLLSFFASAAVHWRRDGATTESVVAVTDEDVTTTKRPLDEPLSPLSDEASPSFHMMSKRAKLVNDDDHPPPHHARTPAAASADRQTAHYGRGASNAAAAIGAMRDPPLGGEVVA